VAQAWQGRALQIAQRYGEQAPMATACCNACRTRVTTNLVALGVSAGIGALSALGRFGKCVAGRL
jgi:hypothetical protein